jgi:predicted dehydrogenase
MLKLGFIGCGGIARHHAKTIQNSVKGLRIAAGAESPPMPQLSAKRSSAPNMMDDYRDLLKTDIDACGVALPTACTPTPSSPRPRPASTSSAKNPWP